jgi:uncharacterized protein (DUF2267 family)
MASIRQGPLTTDDLITVVQAAGTGRDEAERALNATLEVLGDRIDRGEARHLATALPQDLAPSVATTTPAEGFDVDEFMRRLADREAVDIETATRHAAAVFVALQRVLTEREFDHLASQLSRDFLPLLPRGPDIEVLSAEAFIRRVADRAGIGEEQARQATNAVLETLAMRIAGGEVADLRLRLPVSLHPALDEGRRLSGEKALRMGLDEFVERVAQAEGVPPETAIEHVSAVLTTLREAVGEREFLDVTAQLPDDFTALIRD